MDQTSKPGAGPQGRAPESGRADAETDEQPRGVSIKDRRKLRDDDESPQAGSETATASQVEQADGSGELAKARAQADDYLDDLRRLKAEFDNYRKRVLKEQTALVETASASIVARLLSVMDNFELAVAAAEESREFDKMIKGVEMVYGELKELLRSEGVEPINARGAPFDPQLHEAALEVPGDDSGHMVVGEVLRPGYVFKGRVIRPAMVKVTQKAPS